MYFPIILIVFLTITSLKLIKAQKGSLDNLLLAMSTI